MRKLINILFITLVMTFGQQPIVCAQAQNPISYQGVARNAAGNIIANQTISLRLSILQGSTTGVLVYQETHTTTTNSLGLFDVKITSGATTGTFNPLHWEILAGTGAFLKVEMDINGGSAYVDMGTTQLLSVPFALYAEKSGSSVGSVNYVSSWDALSNSPLLVSATGTKGDYYVVNVAGNTALSGITDWQVGDWAIYNGTIWQKVDNSESPVSSSGVGFTPGGNITATNVQDAINELDNKKVNKAGDTMTGDLILHANPSSALGAATKQYVDAGDATLQTQVNAKVNRAGDTMTGDLILNANPSSALGAATKQYVDAGDASLQTQVNAKLNLTGGTMTGNLVLNADPTTALGAATKKYVDDNLTNSGISGKADKVTPVVTDDIAILNSTGNLVDGGKKLSDYLHKGNTDPYTPSANYNPATKKYVDDSDQIKADKIIPASSGNFAALSATGNLVDGGKKSSDFLSSTTIASGIPFVVTPDITSTNVQDAIVEVNDQFATLIDSYIHRNDDGVTIYQSSVGAPKRFGLGGETTPECPLGIKGEVGNDDKMITMTTADGTAKWNINLNPTGNDVDGFSIDDATSGISSSRLFIQPTTGFVGIGTVTPEEKLHIEKSTPSGMTGIKILNTATTANLGWSVGHISDNTSRSGALSTFEVLTSLSTSIERMVILPGGNVGINEQHPFATLHVTKPAADPTEPVNLAENTGILCLGQIDDNNLVMDSKQIQARTGSYVGGSTLSFTPTELNLQPLGGQILIHNASTLDNEKVIVTNDGRIGIGNITPSEKIEINGAIKIGTSINTNDGTIRFTGSDFEGRKGGAWVSLTAGNGPWTNGIGNSIYYLAGTAPRVAIGTTQADATLHVESNSPVTTSSIGAIVTNKSTTTSSVQDDNRVGLQVDCQNTWGGDPHSKNVGLYVKEVSGQTAHEVNLAAVLNGNVVIGNISSSPAIGTNGKNVLAIQSGSVPNTAVGSVSTGGIQIFSDDLSFGPGSPPSSTFSVMNGDGSIIKLYRTTSLTSPDNSSVSSSSYGSTESSVINNLRTRINELEARLQALGLLN